METRAAVTLFLILLALICYIGIVDSRRIVDLSERVAALESSRAQPSTVRAFRVSQNPSTQTLQ